VTPTQEKIVKAVKDADGEATWGEVVETLTYPERQRALHEIRPLEKQEILHRLVVRNPESGEMSFTIKLGIHPRMVEV